jgi:hypothetical protein
MRYMVTTILCQNHALPVESDDVDPPITPDKMQLMLTSGRVMHMSEILLSTQT